MMTGRAGHGAGGSDPDGGDLGAALTLPAVRPSWRRDADVVIVGSGGAGISAALTAVRHGLRVLVVTKDLIGGATPLAQGGLAAALGPGDSAAAHAADTLTAGAGLCEPEVVASLAAAAPGAIDWLGDLGAELERTELRLEGGHGRHRIVHSGNDATGAEVHRALLAALLASGVEILDRTVALDLVLRDPGAAGGNGAEVGPAGRAVDGLMAANIGPGGTLEPGLISARIVVLAAGGLGQAFATTSNPAGATGDAIAMAARAGAVLRDLEFVQFHPTVLWLPGATGQCPLITEALRGAGAVLRDLGGEPLMAGHDPRGDLAPRDVVAARIHEVITARGGEHVWLDATALGRELLEDGFPTVTAACRKYGIDPVSEFIPVAPGAHYSCGGVLADLDGRTTIDGLYAVGEAASTGVQGANRLASNSVTEAVIAGRRAGEAIARALGGAAANLPKVSSALQEHAGVTSGAMPGGADSLHGTPGGADYRGAFSQRGDFSPLSGGKSSTIRKVSTLMRPAATLPVTGEVPGDSGGVPDRRELAAAMSRWAGVMRDSEGLERIVSLLSDGDGAPGMPLGESGGALGMPLGESGGALGMPLGESTAELEGREAAASVPPAGCALDLESVEAANLRVVSWLIAAGALGREESRGCHRRRDAAETAERAWHTLARWDGERLVMAEAPL